MAAEREPPSLPELSVRAAIDNVRHLGSVDGMDTPLLRRILPHCTLDQLARIESLTEKDLTSVTDVLWKRFYQRDFGEENMNHVVDRMRRSEMRYRWKDLFRAKTEKQKEVVDEMVEALASKCRARNAEKQSKRTKLCTKVPPSSSGGKRSYFGGPGSGYKNPMLKKARMEVDSRAKMQAAAIHRSSAQPTATRRDGQPMRTTAAIRRPSSNATI